MALNRERIVEQATALLGEQGLGGLSMRRLADGLGVRPGALYYHVPSKQDLLVAVAEHLLATTPAPIPDDDPRAAATALRAALLRVRDGAELVSFAHAFRPEALAPLHGLHRAFDLAPARAHWAARTLVHYVLGFVAEEQNYAELHRTGIVEQEAAREAPDEAFAFGVEAIVRGVAAVPE
ncbi:TetR/AcrR family transcriptional regulator [Pseudonocardia phyllosphaerae]|uniref:TetR/AcrR family transcriptional regulator n=1 Tax=Pseudonocardia phyllosphaerae TaxID=3390502 RepID=UPI00397A63B7